MTTEKIIFVADRLSSPISAEYADKLESIASDMDVSTAEIVRTAIYEYIDRRESEQHNDEGEYGDDKYPYDDDGYPKQMPDINMSNIMTIKLDDLFCKDEWHREYSEYDIDLHHAIMLNRKRILHAVSLYGQSCGMKFTYLSGLPIELKETLVQLLVDVVNELTHGVIEGSTNSQLSDKERTEYISKLEQWSDEVV